MKKPKPQRKFDCGRCGKFEHCNSPCRKAEAYANKDEVKQKEETIGIPVMERPANLCVRDGLTLTPREHEILTLLEIHDFSRGETAQYLKISRKCLKSHLLNIRRKIAPKSS